MKTINPFMWIGPNRLRKAGRPTHHIPKPYLLEIDPLKHFATNQKED